MSNICLKLSHKTELGLHARVVADVQACAAALNIEVLITGAFARDLHLHYATGIPIRRETRDVDFALLLADWEAFRALRLALLDQGFAAAQGVEHRLRHPNGLPVDLVPFGGLEDADRKIAWPPAGDVVMDVLGFREALTAAVRVELPQQVLAHAVSLPGLTWLKIICWQERHLRSPGKDAQDLQLILNHYLDAGNEARLWTDFLSWTQEDDFDYLMAGAKMLGVDIAMQLGQPALAQVISIVQRQCQPDQPGKLPNEMNLHDPEQAAALLQVLLVGMTLKKIT
jgi:predicted nucleotidyltransferase